MALMPARASNPHILSQPWGHRAALARMALGQARASAAAPVPQPGAGSADLVSAGARAQHQRAHAELLLVVLHPFAGCANGDVVPLPIHLGGEERTVSTMSPLHQSGTAGFLQSCNIHGQESNCGVVVQSARVRAAAGFGKRINIEQGFPGSPDHQAGLGLSD